MSGDRLLRKAAEALELSPIESFWDDLVSHLGRTLSVDWVFVAKLLPGTETRLQTLAAWHRGHPVQDFDSEFIVPFDKPLANGVSVHIREARDHVQHAWLKRVRAEAFGQVKLISPLGQARGLITIAHSRPLERASEIESLLRIYAFKAVVELERECAYDRFYSQLLNTLQAPAVR
jgi:hypothetical protein